MPGTVETCTHLPSYGSPSCLSLDNFIFAVIKSNVDIFFLWLEMTLVCYDKEIASEALATALPSSSPDPVRINSEARRML